VPDTTETTGFAAAARQIADKSRSYAFGRSKCRQCRPLAPTGACLSAASAIPVGATGGYDGREAACLTQPRQQVLLPLRARSRTSRAPTPSAEANADADGDQDSVAAGRARTCPQGVGARLAREADYAKCQANQVHRIADKSQCRPIAPAGARLSAASAIPVGATGGYDGREAACLTQPRQQVSLPLRARSRTSRAPTPSAEANADADANADGDDDGDGDQDGGGRPILSEGHEAV